MAITPKQEQPDAPPMAADAAANPYGSSADAPMEILDVESDEKAPPGAGSPPPGAKSPAASGYPGGFAIDVCFEASKLPLDVAIFNSARAAGGDDKIRKYLQAVLVIGGTALIPGIAHALESRWAAGSSTGRSCIFFSCSDGHCRLQAIATPLVQNMEKVQIIPAPKEVDPRVLAWKGAAVLGKMDSASDLWITAADWVGYFFSERPLAFVLTYCLISSPLAGHSGHERPKGAVLFFVTVRRWRVLAERFVNGVELYSLGA